MRFLRILAVGTICCMSLALLTAGSDLMPSPQVQQGADGVQEVVSRARRPLPPPWRLEEDLIIGVEYGDEEFMIRGPRDFTVLEDGSMVILDSNPVQLRVYDPAGRFIREFGQAGRGPTDLPSYAVGRGVFRDAGQERFEIWSGWPTRIQTWNISGEMLSVETMGEDHPLRRGRAPRIIKLSGERIYGMTLTVRSPRQELRQWVTTLLTSSWEATEADTVRIVEHSEMPFETGWFLEGAGVFPWDDILLTRNGNMYLSSYEDDWIRELDPVSGKELLRFKWEHEPDSFSQMDFDSPNKEFVDNARKGFEWFQERVSIMHLAEGPGGEIWAQRIVWPRGGAGRTFRHSYEEGTWPTDVFSATGQYRGRMILPYEPRIQKMIGDYIYAIGSTEGGASALIRFRPVPVR